MSEITINNQRPSTTYYTARVVVKHWEATLVDTNTDADGTVVVTTTGACTITAILGDDSASTAIDITNSIAVIASGSNGLSKSEANEPANTITLRNNCTEPVQFLFAPGDAPAQTHVVPANESLPINTADQWTAQAYITMKDVVTNGATNAVGFNDANATVSIVVDEKNNYSLEVTAD